MKKLLIIFVKNPILGKVKTRLAADIGNERALYIYQKLQEKTHDVTDSTEFIKWVFYTEKVEEDDLWNQGYEKKVQQGFDLGERMTNAFEVGFTFGYRKICIIGSDCYELDTNVLKKAFNCLQSHDFVIGPAADGGYYLLGMNKFHPEVFKNKAWSTDRVLPQTIKDIELTGRSYYLLPTLNDIQM